MQKHEFTFLGHEAVVLMPEKPNGKWIWKTEFFYAFDGAEQALLEQGYARVYFGVSDRYGSPAAVRLMHAFHRHLIENFALEKKSILFGFSRGGLYAFNYALFYPEYVEKVYLDAPVMDMKSWPPKGSKEQGQVFDEFALTEQTLTAYKGNPVDNLEEYFSLNIPTLLIAGGKDSIVPLAENGGKMIAFVEQKNKLGKGLKFGYIVKPECEHHPHSLADVAPILKFVNEK